MRSTWNRKSLEIQGKRVVDRAETLDGVVAGKEFSAWVEGLLVVAEVIILVSSSLWSLIRNLDGVYPSD